MELKGGKVKTKDKIKHNVRMCRVPTYQSGAYLPGNCFVQMRGTCVQKKQRIKPENLSWWCWTRYL